MFDWFQLVAVLELKLLKTMIKFFNSLVRIAVGYPSAEDEEAEQTIYIYKYMWRVETRSSILIINVWGKDVKGYRFGDECGPPSITSDIHMNKAIGFKTEGQLVVRN